MANLTIALDDELLRAARIKAVAQGTSVNEVCREAIERFAGLDAGRQKRVGKLLGLADRLASQTPAPWPGRDALYEEMLSERSKPR